MIKSVALLVLKTEGLLPAKIHPVTNLRFLEYDLPGVLGLALAVAIVDLVTMDDFYFKKSSRFLLTSMKFARICSGFSFFPPRDATEVQSKKTNRKNSENNEHLVLAQTSWKMMKTAATSRNFLI